MSSRRSQQALSNFKADLAKGENLELYALAVLSFILSIIGFFVGPATGVAFGIAALYVSDRIRERHRSAGQLDEVDRLVQTVQALIERLDDPSLDRELVRARAAAAAPTVLPKGVVRK